MQEQARGAPSCIALTFLSIKTADGEGSEGIRRLAHLNLSKYQLTTTGARGTVTAHLAVSGPISKLPRIVYQVPDVLGQ